MPTERTAIRHVREVLRLRTAGISGNEIARRLNLAPSTVRLPLQRLATAGLSWPLSAELTDAALEARLFTAVGPKQGHRNAVEIGRDVLGDISDAAPRWLGRRASSRSAGGGMAQGLNPQERELH